MPPRPRYIVHSSTYADPDNPQRNKALLDILEGFSQNLEISLDRLQAREEMLGFGKNEACVMRNEHEKQHHTR